MLLLLNSNKSIVLIFSSTKGVYSSAARTLIVLLLLNSNKSTKGLYSCSYYYLVIRV